MLRVAQGTYKLRRTDSLKHLRGPLVDAEFNYHQAIAKRYKSLAG